MVAIRCDAEVVLGDIRTIGEYTRYQGRKYIVDFDWAGCRPLGEANEVVTEDPLRGIPASSTIAGMPPERMEEPQASSQWLMKV